MCVNTSRLKLLLSSSVPFSFLLRLDYIRKNVRLLFQKTCLIVEHVIVNLIRLSSLKVIIKVHHFR
jgi:hypothetical protein